MPTVTGTSSSARTTGTAPSLTFSHTSNGDPLYVSIIVGWDLRFATAVTFGGVALTFIARRQDSGSGITHDWWRLAAPTAGTANIVVTSGATENYAACARNINLSDLSGAVRHQFYWASGSGTTPTLTVPSIAGNLVLDQVYSNVTSQVFTQGAGQTLDVNMSSQANTEDKLACSSETAAGATTALDWTLSVTDAWSLSALVISDTPSGLAWLQSSPKKHDQFNGPPINMTQFSVLPQVGNAIVVPIMQDSQAFLPPAVTDNWGNPYYLVSQQRNSSSGHAVAIFVCPKIVATGSPFQIQVSENSNYCIGNAIEFSGLGSGWLGLDQIAGATGNSAAPNTGNTPALKTTSGNCLAVAVFAINTTQSSSPTVVVVSPVWREEWEHLAGSGGIPGEGDWRILTGMNGLTTNASWACSNSQQWAATLAVFALSADLPAAESRVSHYVVEALNQPASTPRVTQYAVELISGTPPAQGWVTQVVVETLTSTVLAGPGGTPNVVWMGDGGGTIWIE